MARQHLTGHLRGTGLVYFIAEPPSSSLSYGARGSMGRRYVKVGYTNNLDRLLFRIRDLQIGNPRALSVLAVIENVNVSAEAAVHIAWAKWRLVGEWFLVSETILDRLVDVGLIRGVPGLKARPMADRGAA
jgi:hypothetical protein